MAHADTVANAAVAHQTVSGAPVDDLVPDGRGDVGAPSPDCPVEIALAAIAGRWTTLILRDLSRGPLSYGRLKRGLPGLSDKVLSDRLQHLRSQGLVRRTEVRGYPSRTTYTLTAAGHSLRPLLVELYATGTRLARARAQ
ncbi:winged helix-turn-helix transcriptional regulator [Halostreptopolyspora alba]|uniref:Transcriptional regulator n=1 Tax=Halostreptopolyspora alba TaxID=2487137 RepID=A0A3N0E488_9ACTN|nr:transcriptional regulator [Nocardiopsaceae bacterium YIM 96095]